VLEATAGAVSWAIAPNADFDINWILLKFSADPETAEYISITYKSHLGTAYDIVIADEIAPMGYTSIKIPCITGMQQGDSILVEYTNTDGNTITGVCSYVM
jgi:hypothetical protein